MKPRQNTSSTSLVAAGLALGFYFFLSSSASGVVRYVDVASTNATPPYTNWATAAVIIQDAVDASVSGDEIVVTNGIYANGGRVIYGALTNRVAVDKPLTLRSVNGPEFTVIQGYQVPGTTNGDGAIRCVYLTNDASLAGFTLTNGATLTSGSSPLELHGGGVGCESTSAVITNCWLLGNAAYLNGGGAYFGTLLACTLTGNSAHSCGAAQFATLQGCLVSSNRAYAFGGGVGNCDLSSCVLTGNSAFNGAAAYQGVLNDCVVSNNESRGVGGGVSHALLNNCTLTGNSARDGGGASYCTLNDCTLSSNVASDRGGGAFGVLFVYGRLNNCLLTNNLAGMGGGVFGCSLANCTLAGNSATNYGGGAFSASLSNSIVYNNTARYGGDSYSSTLSYCCTKPMAEGIGNITNTPLFVDYAGGNLRLQSNSPCINAGLNAYASGATDLDGNPRIVSGTVDIGAYEFQGSGSVISYAWLQGYGLPTDGSVDAVDLDADGLNTWQEWRCLTDPTNSLSVLRLLSATHASTSVEVSWQSVPGVSYFLERSTDLSVTPPFTHLATNLPGQAGTTTFTDTNAAATPRLFYRVGVP